MPIFMNIPVTERYTGTSNQFVEIFCDDIANSPGFGRQRF